MKRRISFLLLAIALAGTATAQEKGGWRPASKTAESITGDIVFGDDTITINFARFPLAEIRALTPSEALAVFDGATNGKGHLYRLVVPATQKFQHRNTLCGSEETDWMATYVTGRTLQMAIFSGKEMPVMTVEAINNSTSLCGIFTYGP